MLVELRLVEQRYEAVREVLDGVGSRHAHSARVASQAAKVQTLLPPPWSDALNEAAWLHDIGYSDEMVESGFHPLDGARWLGRQGWEPEVCRLVAWHTRSGTEAELRGLRDELEAEFAPPPIFVQAVMAWADLTSSPAGECCTVDDRLADVLRRYPAGFVVHEATVRSRAVLGEWVREVEATVSRSGGLEA